YAALPPEEVFIRPFHATCPDIVARPVETAGTLDIAVIHFLDVPQELRRNAVGVAAYRPVLYVEPAEFIQVFLQLCIGGGGYLLFELGSLVRGVVARSFHPLLEPFPVDTNQLA